MKLSFKNCINSLFLFVIYLSSCKPPNPGIGQPSVKSNVLIFSPCRYSQQYPTTSTSKYISFRTKLQCLTTDASHNPIKYPGSPIVDIFPTSTYFQNGKEFALDQPKGATIIVLDVEIDTRECGWPIPSHAAAGNASWEYLSPVHQYPVNITIFDNQFSEFYFVEC